MSTDRKPNSILRSLFFVGVLVNALVGSNALAFTNDEFNAITQDRPLYDPSECDSSTAATPTPTATPTSGKVSADSFGGRYQGGQWWPSNTDQGGLTPYDDSGLGSDGLGLTGQTAFAELGTSGQNIGNALGGLSIGTKVAITYNGKTIIAEKEANRGPSAAVNGKVPAIGLWWETAKLLGMNSGSGAVSWAEVSDDTAVTPLTGSPSSGPAPSPSPAPTTPTAGAGANCSCPGGTAGPVNLTGSDNIQRAFNYFVSKGLTGPQAAGIVGNLQEESGVNPKSVQGGGPGRGIAQWSKGGRWDELIKYEKIDPFTQPALTALGTELDYVWHELSTSYGNALKAVKATNTAAASAQAFEQIYEGAGIPNMATRVKFAEQALAKYGGSQSGGAGVGTGTSGSACPNDNASVDCTIAAGSTTGTTAGLTPLRQSVVCLAKNELALWKANKVHPGWSNPPDVSKYNSPVGDNWCGFFVAYIYKQAKDPLPGNPAYVPNYELSPINGGKFHWHPSGSGYAPKPGDIATHRGFHHVNIYVGTTGGVQQFIGGNQVSYDQYQSRVSVEAGTSSDGFLSPD